MLAANGAALWSTQRLCRAHNLILKAGMAGHSKWSTIKRAKGAADAQKASIFAKLGRQLRTALGSGGNTVTNTALQIIIQRCKEAQMPKDVIERAIERGVQSKQGNTLRYEGTGPHGVSVILNAITDNKSRTAALLREAFRKHSANLGSSVLFKFKRIGHVALAGVSEDRNEELMNEAINLGAEELDDRGEGEWIIKCEPESLTVVSGGLKKAGFEPETEAIVFEPVVLVPIEAGEQQDMVGKFLDDLEAVDDVDEIFHDANMNA